MQTQLPEGHDRCESCPWSLVVPGGVTVLWETPPAFGREPTPPPVGGPKVGTGWVIHSQPCQLRGDEKRCSG
ncbi:MAG: hypothetical protein ACI4LJ_07630, partial [Anaerovoracaceae bacterium]